MWKWKILSVSEQGIKIVLSAEFAYAWQTSKDGEVQSHKGAVEAIELPVVMTQDQIVQFLNVYWAQKYALLDTLSKTLGEVKMLEGYTNTQIEGDE